MAQPDKLIAKSEPTIKDRVRILFNSARMAASFLVLPLAHVKFATPGKKGSDIVHSYTYVPAGCKIIREFRHRQLISPHLFWDRNTGNWTATVHDDFSSGRITVEGFPVQFVEIPDSADLSEAEALQKGLNSGFFTR